MISVLHRCFIVELCAVLFVPLSLALSLSSPSLHLCPIKASIKLILSSAGRIQHKLSRYCFRCSRSRDKHTLAVHHFRMIAYFLPVHMVSLYKEVSFA